MLARIPSVVLHAGLVLIRRRLRKAIFGLGMGPLLPHLVSSVSRAVNEQDPSEAKLRRVMTLGAKRIATGWLAIEICYRAPRAAAERFTVAHASSRYRLEIRWGFVIEGILWASVTSPRAPE